MFINWKFRLLVSLFILIYGLLYMARREAPELTRLVPFFFDNAPNFLAAWCLLIGLLGQSSAPGVVWMSKIGLMLDPAAASRKETAGWIFKTATATAAFLILYEFQQKQPFLNRRRTFDPLDIAATVLGVLSCVGFVWMLKERGALWSTDKTPRIWVVLSTFAATIGALLFYFYW